ncbi:hypothetical protein HOK51_11635 [Candidatus Woesearchaeota archaeon]|jgi:plastocyanin|nr:hypothetical protein [Candidatus Woesearchaeota archaeon]MBT7368585.1 hypothetical protein [Candidatus Woesearchaeota archaeon]
MKKAIILLAIAVICSLLIGCGSDTPDQPTIESEPIETNELNDLSEILGDEVQEPIGMQNLEDDALVDEIDDVDEEVSEVTDEVETESAGEEESEETSLTAMIVIKDFKVYPSELKIKVGTTVTWENKYDSFNHIIGWKGMNGAALKKGETWSYTFTEPGTIKWFSTARPTTQGKIIVEE